MAAFIAALVAKVPPEGTPPPEPQRYMCMVSIAQSTLSRIDWLARFDYVRVGVFFVFRNGVTFLSLIQTRFCDALLELSKRVERAYIWNAAGASAVWYD